MSKIIFKRMHVYTLHRTNELDHEKGRPAILLKYKSNTSLVWWGTHLKDNKTYEKPLILKINDVNGFFYSKGIEKVNSIDLKQAWVDFRTYKAYSLTSEEQKELISKFVTFTFEVDPYLEIKKLNDKIEQLLNNIKVLEKVNKNSF